VHKCPIKSTASTPPSEGRYAIERELGEGGIAIVTMLPPVTSSS
ncbi:uncharacterized protein METZ01_LOCUS21210, partial [marine metagenome]